MASNAAWLAQITEEALEPDLKICDAHHHLWGPRPDPIAPQYLLEDYLADVNSGHNIVSTIYVEERSMYRAEGPDHLKPVGEVEFANGIAAMSASGLYGKTRVAAGIVGNADMTRGEAVGEVLDAMIAVTPARFRGVRHVTAWDVDPKIRSQRNTPPGLLLDENFRRGVREVGRRNLVFETSCFHPQLMDLVGLARAVPETTIICNHGGRPLGIGQDYAGRRIEILTQWKRSMAELASCLNAGVKLGGLFMVPNGFGWHDRARPPTSDELAAAARPYHNYLIEIFGPNRCMFESNFPVDKISCSYGVLWNAFKKLTRDLSADESAKLFHDSAATIYRLPR